jgi:hypothetical protein
MWSGYMVEVVWKHSGTSGKGEKITLLLLLGNMPLF